MRILLKEPHMAIGKSMVSLIESNALRENIRESESEYGEHHLVELLLFRQLRRWMIRVGLTL